ncbi:MAG: crAss001_48 related protein, partial [bacterium]
MSTFKERIKEEQSELQGKINRLENFIKSDKIN